MTLFQKGMTKHPDSGRKPGVVNKKTLLMRSVLGDLGFDPIKEVIQMIQDNKLEPKHKADICMQLAQYLYPKPQPIADLPESGLHSFTVEEIKLLTTYAPKPEIVNEDPVRDS